MSDPLVSSQFIFESAPFPSCHASTIAETADGLIAAWFGGTCERDPDVGIWTSRFVNGAWSAPIEIADGVQIGGAPRQPCWNPVLFRPAGGPLMLFYKVGPSPAAWWGMVKTSGDHGLTWSDASRLPDDILGPIKNKPVQLDEGDILSPCSVEGRDIGWRVYFERSGDGGRTWNKTPYVDQPPDLKSIQPSVLIHSASRLQALGRTKSGRMFETWSDDAGRTWSAIQLIDLPNPNSGTDAVTLRDGLRRAQSSRRHVLVYNRSAVEKVRVPLNVAVSEDGHSWRDVAVLEDQPPGQYSYPAVIQASDGVVHITYTWKRERIRHAVLDPRRF